MVSDGQEIETLVALGLNHTQARVYLTLLKVGKAKAKKIWEYSKVARQDIYRILTELEKKSIVEKIIDTPAEFRAVPLQAAVSVLLEEKQTEYSMAMEKSKDLIERFAKNQKTEANAREYETKIISTDKAYLRKLEETATTTNRTIDIIESFNQLSYDALIYSDLLSILFSKKVKYRIVINRPEKDRKLPELFMKNADLVEVRFISKEPVAMLRIDDKKQATLGTIKTFHSDNAAKLFSDSPYFVSVLQDYFERVWNEAVEDVNIWNPQAFGEPLIEKP